MFLRLWCTALRNDLTEFPLHYLYDNKKTSNENKEKYQLGDYWLIKFQILQTSITWIVWQIVKRITNEILGVKGSNPGIYGEFQMMSSLTPPDNIKNLQQQRLNFLQLELWSWNKNTIPPTNCGACVSFTHRIISQSIIINTCAT